MQPITKKQADVQKRTGGLRRFAAGAGVAAAILLHTILPLPQARAGDAPAATAPSVLSYPNFSGGGVHGNPAIWPQYGNWGRLEIGKDVATDDALSKIYLSSKLSGDLQGLVMINNSFISGATKTGISGVLALPLFAGVYIGQSAGLDSKGAVSGLAGIAHILRTEGFLLRTGVGYDFVASLATVGSEARFNAGPLELTASANAKGITQGKERGYAGQTIGAQIRDGRHIVSFGVGGRSIGNWRSTQAHYRFSPTKIIALDFYLNGMGQGLFKNPTYAGVGITRSF